MVEVVNGDDFLVKVEDLFLRPNEEWRELGLGLEMWS